uniref:Uncharacterized protein n=1 Tax=Arundo donax TaxID=35708 RepID=A0A0A9ANE6_ARUDO
MNYRGEYMWLVDGEETLWRVVLIVYTHLVPPTIGVAQICELQEPARSATQTYFSIESIRHIHHLLPPWW